MNQIRTWAGADSRNWSTWALLVICALRPFGSRHALFAMHAIIGELPCCRAALTRTSAGSRSSHSACDTATSLFKNAPCGRFHPIPKDFQIFRIEYDSSSLSPEPHGCSRGRTHWLTYHLQVATCAIWDSRWMPFLPEYYTIFPSSRARLEGSYLATVVIENENM